MSTSSTPSLTPSRSSSPQPPPQPDHFYGSTNSQFPPSPQSDRRTWLSPEDDTLAHRGIPVFKPTMQDFQDFEQYILRIEAWGLRSGIVKVIPPKEWTDALPPLQSQLKNVKIKTPIEQHMLGRGGLFRQENMEKRKIMSVREWVELCNKEDFRAPGVGDVGLHARSATVKPKPKKSKKKAVDVKVELNDMEIDIKEEPEDEDQHMKETEIISHPTAVDVSPATPSSEPGEAVLDDKKPKRKRVWQTKEAREASLADRAVRDLDFLESFNPHEDWLPTNTKASDYTPEFCQKLERQYWRNCGLGKPAWYGADTQGSLFTDQTTSWNVAHLPSTLSRLLPPENGLPGVNTPYLYFGMWRATFSWHVEDMDLFSINYIHFGAPKFWYSVPQGRASALEQTMRGYFPKDVSRCPQFLRHKSFLVSPTLLAQSSCRPNHLVQHAGEFVITFPRGYHAGFNLGSNCAESVNFALDSWIELGKRARVCECITDSVRIDVDQLLRDRAIDSGIDKRSKKENEEDLKPKKRKSDGPDHLKSKKLKTKPQEKVSPPKISLTLKLGPRPPEPEEFPCCLCVSGDKGGLLLVHDPPAGRKEIEELAGNPKVWMAHESCANVVPETWVDEVEESPDGIKKKFVFGVDAIVKDRWSLKCSACTKTRHRAHGAPVQCTKGKCSKAFHVCCARDGHNVGIVFSVLREVEKEVVLVDTALEASANDPASAETGLSSAAHAIAAFPTSFTESGFVDIQSGLPPTQQASSSKVLKVIKKQDVEILCTQHNPIVTAAKKAGKQDKMKADLLALPSMARIKIRVSAGVFEVSLIRVIEETKSVEVLWDRGIKREFKWGSVVFGSTGANVQQKPSEMISESEGLEPGHADSVHGPPASGIVAGTQHSTADQQKYPPSTQYYFHSQPYGYWPYQGAAQPYTGSQPYTYGYYATAGSLNHSSYMFSAGQHRANQITWQQPYEGPTNTTGSMPGSHPKAQPVPSTSAPTTVSASNSSTPVPSQHVTPEGDAAQQPKASTPSATAKQTPDLDSLTKIVSQQDEQGIIKDLVSLATMEPSQIADALRENPQLRDIVWAAVDEAKRASSLSSVTTSD